MNADCRTYNARDFQRIMELPGCPAEVVLRDHFRARSWELHPDVCCLPNAAERFGELRSMYEQARGTGAWAGFDAGLWDDAGGLKDRYALTVSSRVRSGLVRRIAQLEGWNSLPFLYQVLARRDYPAMWAAVHAFIRLESRSAASRLEACYPELPQGLRCAILRYAHVVDHDCSSGLARQIWRDPDHWIAQRRQDLWGEGSGGASR